MVNTRNVNKYDIKDIIIYIGMLTKLAFVALMVHDTIHDKYSHTCMTKNVSKMPLTLRHVQKTHDITVQTFLKESMLTPFILYTVMNDWHGSVVIEANKSSPYFIKLKEFISLTMFKNIVN